MYHNGRSLSGALRLGMFNKHRPNIDLTFALIGRCTADIRTVFTSVRAVLNTSADYRLNIRMCLAMHRWALIGVVRVDATTWLN